MTLLQAIVYGFVQGFAEFLPISSSAHLVALPKIFGWTDPGVGFDVALHVGTLIAVVFYFWKDIIKLISAGFTKASSKEGKLFWYLIIASIPGALFGALLNKKAEAAIRNLGLIGILLIVMGIILYYVDKNSKHEVDLDKMDTKKSLIIGFSQALAIIPGFSRSGITMTAGLFLGLKREAAARFSFLMSVPIILGAAVWSGKDLLKSHAVVDSAIVVSKTNVAVGVITAAIVGFLCIKFMLDYVKKKGYGIFTIYRIVVGLLFISIYFINK